MLQTTTSLDLHNESLNTITYPIRIPLKDFDFNESQKSAVIVLGIFWALLSVKNGYSEYQRTFRKYIFSMLENNLKNISAEEYDTIFDENVATLLGSRFDSWRNRFSVEIRLNKIVFTDDIRMVMKKKYYNTYKFSIECSDLLDRNKLNDLLKQKSFVMDMFKITLNKIKLSEFLESSWIDLNVTHLELNRYYKLSKINE